MNMLHPDADKEINPKDTGASQLLFCASDDLRTPLSVIKCYTEMLLSDTFGAINDKQIQYLKTIQSSNQKSINLIHSLLNIVMLDLNIFTISPVETDIRFLIKHVIAENKEQIDEKKLSLKEEYLSEISGMLPSLLVDKEICLILLRSIISNAVIFSKEEGVVQVTVRDMKQGELCDSKKLTDDSFVVIVTDSGIGIPDTDKEKIFSKFFKASNNKERESRGSGLSLYAAQLILSKIGGEIWFTSTKDIGSTFYLALPKHGMQKKEGKSTLDYS